MSASPFITVLRSLNYNHLVEDFSDEIVQKYDSMKLPRIEIRLKAMSESFDNQVTAAKNINEYAKTDSLKALSEKIKQIVEFSDSQYENRAFKPETVETTDEIQTNEA